MADDNVKITLAAQWKSMTYTYRKIEGVCTIELPSAPEKLFAMTCIFKYAADSSFRPGETRVYKLNALREGKRIIAQTYLGDDSLMLTFNFAGETICGCYSMIQPIDCGTFRPINSKSQWESAFGI